MKDKKETEQSTRAFEDTEVMKRLRSQEIEWEEQAVLEEAPTENVVLKDKWSNVSTKVW